MFLSIIVAIIVLAVLAGKGVFRKEGQCIHCGKHLKGTEQHVFRGNPSFILCDCCMSYVHPQIRGYAKKNWNYQVYEDYLAWEQETGAERSQFAPGYQYGAFHPVSIDTARGLFSIGRAPEEGLVLRFSDLIAYDMNFNPEKTKDGAILGARVKGHEFISVVMARPNIVLNVNIEPKTLFLTKVGFFSSKFEYELDDEFWDAIRMFSTCAYIAESNRYEKNSQGEANASEIDKALALFMIDKLEQATPEILKQQRNALIKAFHQDNRETNVAYAQKINVAYDLLCNAIAQ